jgi:hypothetical protein
MPLLKLASSILLALLLASLSALASPPAAPDTALHDQSLASQAVAADRGQRLVALAERRRAHGFSTPVNLPMSTIPPAGESIPELGQ